MAKVGVPFTVRVFPSNQALRRAAALQSCLRSSAGAEPALQQWCERGGMGPALHCCCGSGTPILLSKGYLLVWVHTAERKIVWGSASVLLRCFRAWEIYGAYNNCSFCKGLWRACSLVAPGEVTARTTKRSIKSEEKTPSANAGSETFWKHVV